MASVRVRMVRCPKCSELLVELPDLTIYKCGGCETSLQAKNWRPESAVERPQTGEVEAPNSTDKETERLEDGDGNCRVDELCNNTTAPSSHSGSPEVEPTSSTDSIEALGEECKDSPLGEYVNSDIKLNDEEEGIGGGEVGLANRDMGFVSSPGNSSNEEENASKSSPAIGSEVGVDNVDCLQTGGGGGGGGGCGGGDSSRSSPILESHVSLYITSPDDADHLDHSPAARRFSSSDGYGKNVGDFTNHESGSYQAYYGSESSFDENEELNFQPRGNRKNKLPAELPSTSTDPELLHELRSHRSFIRSSLPPRPSSRPLHDPPPSSEKAKMDLLRTVKELKDQLEKMQISNTVFHPSGLQEKYDLREDLSHSYTYGPCRAHPRCLCSRCCPHSSQISSHFLHHCKNGHCCDMSSSSSSPRHCCVGPSHSSSTCDSTKCRGEKVKRLPSKEKQKPPPPPRKHLLPLAGGAPFVACYYCFELLQLPAEFVILDRRRCHMLRCSSCKKVLRLSILNGTKIVRYLPNASATPPPSEAGESSSGRMVSHSDDRSSSRRDLSEREEKNSNSRPDSSDRKMKSVLRDSQKTTSDIKERSKLSNSPLHRLMGYSSPGRVLKN